MSAALVLACLWVDAAAVLAMMPSRDNHWRYAYGLIAVGLPILAYVFWQDGLVPGLIALAAGVSVLRWPVWFLLRWVARRLGLWRGGAS